MVLNTTVYVGLLYNMDKLCILVCHALLNILIEQHGNNQHFNVLIWVGRWSKN